MNYPKGLIKSERQKDEEGEREGSTAHTFKIVSDIVISCGLNWKNSDDSCILYRGIIRQNTLNRM